MHGILQAHGMATDHQATSEVVALLRGILDREGAEDTMRARETLLDDLVGWAHDHGQVRIRWARDLEDAAAHRSSGAEAEERRRRAQADAETMAEARAAEIQDLRRRLAAVEGVDQAKGRRAAAMLEAGRAQVAGLIITGLERRQEAGHG